MFIIFDLDNTLIHTSHGFQAAFSAFTDLVSGITGESAKQINTLLEKHEKINKRVMGMSISRLKKSMLDVFEELYPYDTYNGETARESAEVKKSIKKIVENNYNITTILYRDTIPVLTEMQSAGHTLFLVTIGDPGSQMEKVYKHGLDSFFTNNDGGEGCGGAEGSRIYISKIDKYSALVNIKEKANGTRIISVGDSYERDYKPSSALNIEFIRRKFAIHDENSNKKWAGVESISNLSELLKWKNEM